jgi:hypothetical protein
MKPFASQPSTRRRRTPLLAAIALVALLPFGTVVNAQAQGQPPSLAPGGSGQSATIPDQKLDAAANALRQVAGIKQNYEQKLEGAAPSDQERIANEANDALTKAVTDQGLSIDEYTSILEVAQNDPDVRQKILQRLHRSSDQSGGKSSPAGPSSSPE